MTTKSAAYVLAALVILSLFSSTASAQSTIAGVAKDSSGAVMSGVKVEAASEALIERSRTVTTNSEGRYSIVDVRPGTYTVTFTIEGFTPVKEQVEVPANVTVPVDADLKPGSVGQTVEVQALVATVDVENVAHPEVLTRADMDALPTARNMQSIGSYVPSVHLNTPDVAGSMQVQQTYMAAHGMHSKNDTYLLDGMLINTTQTDGQIQTYVDNEIISEATYQTSNVTAEVSAGGVYTNLIPKDGGNAFHGDLFLGYVNSAFVGSNVNSALVARGVAGQSAVNEIQDFDGSFGGPFKKDKLWFLVTGRKQLTNLQSPGSFLPDGSPGIEYSHIYTGTVRLTYQVNSKNKFAAMWQRDWKTIQDDIVSGAGGYNDTNPLVSSNHRAPVMYYILQTRWTSIPTPKLIFQAGFSFDKLDYFVANQPGILQNPFTPSWYADTTQLDLTKLTRSVAGGQNSFYKFDRYVWNASGAYITGSHQIKFGIQDSFGPAYQNFLFNGDGIANFTNGVPLNFTAEDSPAYEKFYLKHDLGLYAMDTWTIKRVAITAGIRWEYLSNLINPQSAPAGRFVPARSFDKIDCDTIKGMSCFKDWAPRLGLVYDVFGNHKTAIKAGIGKYNIPLVQANLQNFNPMFLTSETLTWNGPSTACAPTCFPTGGFAPPGGSAAPGGLGPNPNPNFGLLNNINLDPNYHREYNWQYSAGVQRELMRGVTLNFNWNHTADYQQTLLTNYSVPPSAWTPQQIYNPLDGTPITVYNLQPQYFGLTPILHQTNSPQSLRSNTYNGFETFVDARLPRGTFAFFGWTLEHQVDRECDQTAAGNALNDPNSLRFCDWTGSTYQDLGKVSGIPYRSEFQLQTNVPLKWGFEANASLISQPVYSTNFNTQIGSTYALLSVFSGAQSGFKEVNWSIGPTTKYPADCSCPNPGGLVDPNLKQGSELIPLIAPGSRLTPRLNQLDVGIRKTFHIHERYIIMAEAQIFNLFNVNTVLTESYTLGSTIKPYVEGGPGGQPSAIEAPRMLRLNVQFKF